MKIISVYNEYKSNFENELLYISKYCDQLRNRIDIASLELETLTNKTIQSARPTTLDTQIEENIQHEDDFKLLDQTSFNNSKCSTNINIPKTFECIHQDMIEQVDIFEKECFDKWSKNSEKLKINIANTIAYLDNIILSYNFSNEEADIELETSLENGIRDIQDLIFVNKGLVFVRYDEVETGHRLDPFNTLYIVHDIFVPYHLYDFSLIDTIPDVNYLVCVFNDR